MDPRNFSSWPRPQVLSTGISSRALPSVDYDRNSQICHDFYASVQNKLEYAVIGKTAAEIITSRANAKHPTMGLLTWRGYQKGGKIQLSDTKIAKNYMTHEELSELTSLVNLCLDSASLTVKRGRPIYMNEWVEQVNAQLKIGLFTRKILGT